MTYQESLDYLNSLEKFGMKLGLSRIKKVLAKLGNPQNKFKSIIVAGTNGKGSTCAYLSSILKEASYKVGLYTSPHLLDWTERIKINGKDISRQEFARILSKLNSYNLILTAFETLTAMAFLYFAQQKVDYAVLEVGLGGRLDATNVVTPEVSVITNIDYEHTEILGKTLKQIRREKAGIIKRGVPVVWGEKLTGYKNLSYPEQNKLCASKVAEILKIPQKSIQRGIAKAKWPGRFQKIGNFILDGAHNPAGAKALRVMIEEAKLTRPMTLILGILGYKDIRGIVRNIVPIFDRVILTKSSHPQAADPQRIAKEFRPQHITSSVKEAIDVAKKLRKKQTIVITGSLFTVADALRALS